MTNFQRKKNIPRSPNYPVFFLRDDAEIIGDGVAPLARVFWDSIPQEADDGIDKFTEGRVVTVVGDVRWSGLFGQLFDQLRWNPAVVVSCGYVGNAFALSIISTAPAAPAKTSVGVR